MKVLEIFGEPISNGGQESFVFHIIQAMDTTGIEFYALTPYYCDNESYRKLIEEKGGSVVCLNLPFCPGKSRNSLFKPLSEHLKQNSYDVVHIHSGSISVLALASAAAHFHRIPRIIVHSHCAADKATLKYRLVKMAMSPLLEICPTDYFACSMIAGEWKFSDRVVKNKLRILKNGVDLDKFAYSKRIRSTMREKMGIAEQTFVVGHVGRFSYQKNHEYLINVFVELKKQRVDSKLLLIGSGEEMDAVRTQVKDARLEEDVYFVGNVNNVNDYLQVMDAFVLPSRFEGLPIVGVEAQANGLPVLVSTNVSEELELTDCISFLSLNDSKLWTRKLCELPVEKRVETAKQLRESGYDIKLTAEELRNIYLGIKV